MKRLYRYYWAYGSNLSVQGMLYRCPTAKKVGPLYVNDGLLVFRGVADVVISKGNKVAGGLWKVTQEDEDSLDAYEGVSSGLYKKCTFTITARGKVRNVLYYRMCVPGIMPPSERYLSMIAEGYRDFGLDLSFLDAAVKHSWREKKVTSRLWVRHERKGAPRWARPSDPSYLQAV